MVPSTVYEWGLTDKAREVYIFLCKTADNEDGTSFPGKKEIASKCGIGVTTVYYAIKELTGKGLVTVTPRYEDGHQKSNLYTVYDAPGEATSTSEQTFPPHSAGEPLPPHDMNPYPLTGRTPTPSPAEHGTIPIELDPVNYAPPCGGAAATPPETTPAKLDYGREFKKVRLHPQEYEGLVSVFGTAAVEDYVARLDAHVASTGKKYPSHYATVYKWITEDQRKAQKKPEAKPPRFVNYEQPQYDYAAIERQERELLDAKLR